jgi:uncharacterized protein (TIGR02145 family)
MFPQQHGIFGNRNIMAPLKDGYGSLYNLAAVQKIVTVDGINVHALAPPGWRVATREDYENLITKLCSLYNPNRYLDIKWWIGGNPTGPYSTIGTHLKQGGTSHWFSGNVGYNTFGFNAVGGGARFMDGTFPLNAYHVQQSGANYWSWDGDAYGLAYDRDSFGYTGAYTSKAGLAVRCVSIEEYSELPPIPAPNTINDIDGNTYHMVSFGSYTGNKLWLAEDYKCTHYADGSEILFPANNAEWVSNTTGAMCNWYDQ